MSTLAKLANVAVWLLVATFIVVFGWSEPLHYNFISVEQARAEEQAYRPTPAPQPDYRGWKRPPSGPGSLETGGLNDPPRRKR